MTETITLTPEQTKMLADQERKMDRKEIPFVMLGRHRIPMVQEVMESMGLESEQTINDVLFIEILKRNIAHFQNQIARKEAK